MRTPRRQRSVPTISDVARLAGVSPMTVSRVINGEGHVRAATREAVDAAIAQLNYAPNPAARTLAGAGQSRIGLLYSNPSAAYLSELLVGSLDQASRRDVQLVVEKCDPGAHELEVARHLIDGGVHGMILPPPLCDSPALVALLAERQMPAVLVGSGSPPERLFAVGIDDAAAAHEMTRHILALGHRRVGFIVGAPGQRASAERLRGYRAALVEAGIAPADDLVAQGVFTYRSGLLATGQLLDLPDPPTAIFASNDDMAAAAVAVAHRRGLDVPRDLTVCGFDDTTLATAIWPELTTIRQPIADMARTAVEMLVTHRRQRTTAEPLHRRAAYTLICRQSDGPPRGKTGPQTP